MSTLSLVFDLTWVQEEVSIGYGTEETLNLTRAARASKIGSRAARFAKIFRWIRLTRISRAWKSANRSYGVDRDKQKAQAKIEKIKDVIKIKYQGKEAAKFGGKNLALLQKTATAMGEKVGLTKEQISKLISELKSEFLAFDLKIQTEKTTDPIEKVRYFSNAMYDVEFGISSSHSSIVHQISETPSEFEKNDEILPSTNRPMLSMAQDLGLFPENNSYDGFNDFIIKASDHPQTSSVIKRENIFQQDHSKDINNLLATAGENILFARPTYSSPKPHSKQRTLQTFTRITLPHQPSEKSIESKKKNQPTILKGRSNFPEKKQILNRRTSFRNRLVEIDRKNSVQVKMKSQSSHFGAIDGVSSESPMKSGVSVSSRPGYSGLDRMIFLGFGYVFFRIEFWLRVYQLGKIFGRFSGICENHAATVKRSLRSDF